MQNQMLHMNHHAEWTSTAALAKCGHSWTRDGVKNRPTRLWTSFINGPLRYIAFQENVILKLFLATVCKTVRPMLSDRCPSVLSVLSVCLSVTLVYCGWIKIKQVGFAPGHVVLDGDPPPPKGHNPQFSAHICYGQMAGWIKMSLRMEVGQDFSLITTVNNSLNTNERTNEVY